jgi:hypothetical protein
MNRQIIHRKLTDVLHDIQRQGGYAAPTITDDTKPLADLEGFDSPLAVEATTELSGRLGMTIPAGENIFKAKGIARALTIREIVEVLVRIATTSPVAARSGNSNAAAATPHTSAT